MPLRAVDLLVYTVITGAACPLDTQRIMKPPAALASLRLAVVGKSTDEKRTRARRTVVYLGTSCAVAETRLWGRWHPPDGFCSGVSTVVAPGRMREDSMHARLRFLIVNMLSWKPWHYHELHVFVPSALGAISTGPCPFLYVPMIHGPGRVRQTHDATVLDV